MCVIQSTELSFPDFTKNKCICLCYHAKNINDYHFSWGFTRDREFNIKQTNKSPLSLPLSNVFVTKVMIAQYGLLDRFHYAFLPLFFHAHLPFPICSLPTELSRVERMQFSCSYKLTKVTRVSSPFKKPRLLLSRSFFLPRFEPVSWSSCKMAK